MEILDISKSNTLAIDQIFSDLVLYTRLPQEQITENIKNSMGLRNTEWNDFSQDSPLNFHKMTEYSIYCLSKWNAEEKYQEIIQEITKLCSFKKGAILDFAGGIGTLSIDLASQNLDVDFLEVPSNTLNYAKWRFKRRFLEIDTYTSLNQIKKNYDIIIALDVFEVLEKPLSHLKKFYQMLNNNGILISSIGNVGEQDHPMNLLSNNEFLNNFDFYCNEIGFSDTVFENKFHLKLKQKIL